MAVITSSVAKLIWFVAKITFVVVDITLKLHALMNSAVAKITIVVTRITFLVADISLLVSKINFVATGRTFKVAVITS